MTTIDLDLGSPVLEAYAADRVLHVRLANGRTSNWFASRYGSVGSFVLILLTPILLGAAGSGRTCRLIHRPGCNLGLVRWRTCGARICPRRRGWRLHRSGRNLRRARRARARRGSWCSRRRQAGLFRGTLHHLLFGSIAGTLLHGFPHVAELSTRRAACKHQEAKAKNDRAAECLHAYLLLVAVDSCW